MMASQMEGCVVAIDGWVCRTRQHTVQEVGPAIASHIWMGGCDTRCRFNLVCAKYSSSTASDVCDLKMALLDESG